MWAAFLRLGQAYPMWILNRGGFSRFEPISQVRAIDLERVANLAGLGNPLFPSDPAIECFQERTLYLTYKPSMANVSI
jgi:hypothetical protein